MTVAAAEAGDNPQLSLRLSSGIPPSLTSSAMAQVGEAAAAGADPSASTFALLKLTAERAPLQPEPLLVQAAIAEREGKLDRALSLLEMARRRAPRSAAARYLLADVFFRQGKLTPGLGELAVLTQIMPDTSVQLVPALAAYAQGPGARENLGRILQINPQLKGPLLNALAADPANADLILALAGPNAASMAGDKSWQTRLLNGVVSQGDYERAYVIWKRLAGVQERARPLLFNGEFREVSAPPPFNWRYASSAAGFAEPANGALRILYYGRENSPLAAQVLLLPPGKYRFNAPVNGSIASNELEWTLTCISGANQVMRANAGTGAVLFQVPPGCAAQTLALHGIAQDPPSDIDTRIGPVTLEAAGQ